MKLITSLYLLATGTLLFFSCTKEQELNNTCENCIIVTPDSLQNPDSKPEIPVVTITGSQATIGLTSSEGFEDSEFVISIGDNGNLLSEHLSVEGLPLSWDFSNLSPGSYPIRIKQTNYVPGSDYPDFNFTITSASETLGPVAPTAVVNNVTNEVEFNLTLQVNQ